MSVTKIMLRYKYLFKFIKKFQVSAFQQIYFQLQPLPKGSHASRFTRFVLQITFPVVDRQATLSQNKTVILNYAIENTSLKSTKSNKCIVHE